MSHWEIRIALVLTLFLAGLPQGASAATPSILDVISNLQVKGRAPKTGYTREQFGPAWKDVDANGCDTRNDILKRDLKSVIYRGIGEDCVILSGVLTDPYSGETISFLRGVATSSEIQID
ncbi:MAG: deoxyribonuclease, partial [Actinobacteria bacterium]|nr:deoxyribonuclease [Actinomycetota bacterium]